MAMAKASAIAGSASAAAQHRNIVRGKSADQGSAAYKGVVASRGDGLRLEGGGMLQKGYSFVDSIDLLKTI